MSHIQKSQTATEVLEGEIQLQCRNATRWNSEVRSIKSILRVPDDKFRLLDVHRLTIHDRSILQDMVAIIMYVYIIFKT